jgi:hypothetical protein
MKAVDELVVHEWVGRLSAGMGEALDALRDRDPKRAQRELRTTLARFIASDVPAEELRTILRHYLK